MFTRSLPESRQGRSLHDLQRVPASPPPLHEHQDHVYYTVLMLSVRFDIVLMLDRLSFQVFVGPWFKVSVALRHALLTEGTNSSKICVWCLCVCMFYVCEVIGFVDWLDRGLIYNIYRHISCEKSLELCICLWPELDCPEVSLCGWRDIKIQLLLLLLLLFHGDH